jgi:transposase
VTFVFAQRCLSELRHPRYKRSPLSECHRRNERRRRAAIRSNQKNQNIRRSSPRSTRSTAQSSLHACSGDRHNEWLKFLGLIDRTVDEKLDIRVIADNYVTHKHEEVQRWLKRHPRFHMHFTPTSSSWLNMVERFFRDITTQAIRRGVFRSVDAVISAIQASSIHRRT